MSDLTKEQIGALNARIEAECAHDACPHEQCPHKLWWGCFEYEWLACWRDAIVEREGVPA